MADTTTPAPAPETKKRKSPGPLDARLLAQLAKDGEIAAAALDEITNDPALAAALATHFIDRDNTVPIDAASLNQLAQQAAAAHAAGAAATTGTAGFHSVTDDEDDEEKTAIAAIRGVQARAKEKYEETDPARLAAYHIGQPLKSRTQITQAGAAILALLRTTDANGQPVTPQDTLPGFGVQNLLQFQSSLGSYGGVQTAQGEAQKKASEARLAFEAACEQVARRRRKLQLAVDAERPFTTPANAPLRTRLGLPSDKGMS
jgi:hypothetical protein